MSSFTIDKTVSPRTGKISYVARWDYEDLDGRRVHRKKSFRTKAEANAHLTDVRAELKSRTYIEPTKQLTGQYLKEWGESLGPPRKSSTIYQYRHVIRVNLADIAHVPLADLKAVHVERMMQRWRKDGMSELTAHNSFRVLRTALKEAVRFGMILRDPTAGIKSSAPPSTRPDVWTPAEFTAFLAASDDHPHGLMFRLLGMTMMREGELAALKWADVDLDAGVISVRRTMRRGEDGKYRVADSAKTRTSVRAIPIGADLVQRLRDHKQAQLERRRDCDDAWNDDDAVFDRGNGEHISTSIVQWQWKKILAHTGARTIRLHDLRHSGATTLINAGVPVKTVSQLLGHSSAELTLRLYVHPSAADHRKATDVLDALAGKAVE